MDKLEFNQLNLQEQVQYINDQLTTTGLSVTKVCEVIGIDRATIRKRFKGLNYIYNKDTNQYENLEASINANNTINASEYQEVDINTLIKKMRALEGRVKTLENTVNTINTSNTNNTINAISIKELKGETVTRAYRIYEDVQDEFKIYCKRHSEHKVQDIISSALVEFMENHK